MRSTPSAFGRRGGPDSDLINININTNTNTVPLKGEN